MQKSLQTSRTQSRPEFMHNSFHLHFICS